MNSEFLKHLQSITPQGKAAEKRIFIPANVIKKEVEARWQAVVPKLIDQRLSDSAALNELIGNEVKRQIKSRIAKLVKAAEGT